VERPPIRYARSGDVQIAYQVTGDGPLDVIWAPSTVSHLDLMWEFPVFRRAIEMWGEVARFVRFDKRGTGLSDRPAGAATLEERSDDIRAVLDAVGLERAVVFGSSEGGQMACMFAAMNPERVSVLALWGTLARWARTPDHPWGLTDEEEAELLAEIEQNWPSERYLRGWGAGLGDDVDPEVFGWFMRLSQAGASPAAAVALERMNAEADVTDILPAIRVPTVVMCASHDPVAPADGVRWMAKRIPGARFIEFDSSSHLWREHLPEIIAAVQEAVTGQPAAVPSSRRLLTMLFVDIASSTERAVEVGDVAWRDLLAAHYARATRELVAHGGREIDRAGDGLLAVFDGPTRAVRCGQAIQREAQELGLVTRAGIHTGEIETDGDGVRGIAVHVAARVCGEAGAGELLVSSTVRDLTAGAGLELADRGLHSLKGVPDERRLFAVVR
jgi:pimeloyl-ACP methyl ester carboxylesterase